MQKNKLSIILPSYLEEENLKLLLPMLNVTLSAQEIAYEIIVVDTVKPLDGTPDVCKRYNSKYINRENDNSFGSAVRTGIRSANGSFILVMDADGSHPPEFIPNMLKYMSDYDIVIASRYVEGGCTENSKISIVMSKVLNIIYATVLNIKCNDVSNNFKIYKTSLLKGIHLYCNNFDIVEEIIYKICKNNKKIKIKEVPFTFKKRMYGQTKRNLIIFIITFIFTLIKLRYGK